MHFCDVWLATSRGHLGSQCTFLTFGCYISRTFRQQMHFCDVWLATSRGHLGSQCTFVTFGWLHLEDKKIHRQAGQALREASDRFFQSEPPAVGSLAVGFWHV